MNKGVKLSEDKITQFEDVGHNTLLSFYDRQKKDGLLVTPFLSEKKFMREFGPFIVVGIVDMAFKTEDGQIAYDITDFKTNSKAKSKEEVAKDHQLTMYSWLFWKELGINPRSLNLHFVKIDKKRETSRTIEQLQEFEKFLLDFYEKIQVEKEWAINLLHCSWCDFRHQCTKTRNARIRLI
jgi:predicted RecB family nuclease